MEAIKVSTQKLSQIVISIPYINCFVFLNSTLIKNVALLLAAAHLSIRERPSGFIGMPVGRANDKTPSEWKVVNI